MVQEIEGECKSWEVGGGAQESIQYIKQGKAPHGHVVHQGRASMWYANQRPVAHPAVVCMVCEPYWCSLRGHASLKCL